MPSTESKARRTPQSSGTRRNRKIGYGWPYMEEKGNHRPLWEEVEIIEKKIGRGDTLKNLHIWLAIVTSWVNQVYRDEYNMGTYNQKGQVALKKSCQTIWCSRYQKNIMFIYVDRIKGWARSSEANPDYKKAPEFEKRYLKKAGGHIGRNVIQT